ncbi:MULTISPECIES: maleylpyruvate isomerase family mycothiol-dependent enzyme [unclassified Crossiella]|uniref:maleylpyruvate isomerase family mycothiol-dependent enzyme n=1 Tax=unclassified Crossiella TaxID=2620835 RepID=UPI001FFE79A8|nr:MULTISPECIES: maleylpyruvate isomerase family mycothiol-dependent enzyme [unclassified Crossiella]MCK2238582.1 maleylpyruvate isomerase family mycothiol-dependent enzyme [Crossiella sp. S99.2]MCK2251848.1 maleylpyruvate isomerase family mycothiol-dependent enzyme [Crossiella sp. S99.1]
MDRDQILDWTTQQRLHLADFLESLPESEWQARSLCPEWTVYEVAAHMTISTRMTFVGLAKAAIRARGSFDRMEATLAIERAARFSPAELIAQVREHAGSAKRTPGSGLLDPLTDALVHTQDIARPLGRVRVMPVEPTVAALEHVLKSAFYGARKRFRGLRLVATDAEWISGEGADEVRGPVGELLLLATGRAAGLAGLSGAGAERLASAFAEAGK